MEDTLSSTPAFTAMGLKDIEFGKIGVTIKTGAPFLTPPIFILMEHILNYTHASHWGWRQGILVEEWNHYCIIAHTEHPYYVWMEHSLSATPVGITLGLKDSQIKLCGQRGVIKKVQDFFFLL